MSLVMCNLHLHLRITTYHFKLNRNDIIALDRAYIDYFKFEEINQWDTVYVTKMKKNLVFKVLDDFIYQFRCGKSF